MSDGSNHRPKIFKNVDRLRMNTCEPYMERRQHVGFEKFKITHAVKIINTPGTLFTTKNWSLESNEWNNSQ